LKKLFIFLFIFLLACTKIPTVKPIEYSPAGINWQKTEIIKLYQYKPIIIYFSSRFCNACKKFESETLSNERIVNRLNTQFVTVFISDYKHINMLTFYLEKFKVSSIPAMVTLSNKKEIARVIGYNDVFGINLYLDLSMMAFQLESLNSIAQELIDSLNGK
jgi:thioredoxin-related protein